MNSEELKQRVAEGDLEAMLQLGDMYYAGDGVERHLTNAINYWVKVALLNEKDLSIRACRRLVQHYSKTDVGKAKDWASREYQMGSADSLIFLATTLCDNYEFERGLFILMSMGKDGNKEAKKLFYHYYKLGIIKPIASSDELSLYMSELSADHSFCEEVLQDSSVNDEAKSHPESSSEKTAAEASAEKGMNTPIEVTPFQNPQELTLVSKLKKYVSIGILAVFVVFMLRAWITPAVVIVDEDRYYQRENSFSDIEYVNKKGEKIIISGHKLFNNYIYNASDRTLIEYTQAYSSDIANLDDFKSEKILIEPHKLLEVNNEPHYFFEEPDTIQVSEDHFSWIWKTIFGDSEIRWILNYNEWTDQEILEERRKIEQKFIASHCLFDGEYTDGRIILKKPNEFTCSKLMSADSLYYYFELEKKDTEFVTVMSEYGDDDTFTEDNFMSVCEGWIDKNLASYASHPGTVERKEVEEVKSFAIEIKYDAPTTIYWNFMLLYSERDGKIAIISYYSYQDKDHNDLSDIYKAIRFR